MKLLVQPGAGIAPVAKAIDSAKKSVEIVIFRFDRKEVERALINAAGRGVFVHALVAHTNQGGEKSLRDLESRLLAAGVTVARTADDLVRYHDKLMIIDRRELHLFAFNYTFLDTERSRSFGIVTTNRKLVAEAVRLFEADTKRQPYDASTPTFLVSPANARTQLAALIKRAQKEIVIYDPKVSDPVMMQLLEDRARAGVDVRIIGKVGRETTLLQHCQLPDLRLHTRTIVIDRERMFIGSQSLRAAELDARREVGIILRDPKVVAKVLDVFESDWKNATSVPAEADVISPAAKVAKKTAKVLTKSLPPVAAVVEAIVKEVVGDDTPVPLIPEELEETVKVAVREAVKEAILGAVEQETRVAAD